MANERNAEGWLIEEGEFFNSFNRSSRNHTVEVNMDGEHVEVRIENGTGYMRESCETYIPVALMVQMLQRAGYTVTR